MRKAKKVDAKASEKQQELAEFRVDLRERAFWITVNVFRPLRYHFSYFVIGSGGRQRSGEIVGTAKSIQTRRITLDFSPRFAGIVSASFGGGGASEPNVRQRLGDIVPVGFQPLLPTDVSGKLISSVRKGRFISQYDQYGEYTDFYDDGPQRRNPSKRSSSRSSGTTRRVSKNSTRRKKK